MCPETYLSETIMQLGMNGHSAQNGVRHSTMSTPSIQQAIETADRAFEKNFGQHDAQGMAALYTTDGQCLPPGGDVVSGRDEIAAFWQQVFDMGVANAELETIEVEAHGDTAIEVGRFALNDPDGQEIDHGSFIVIWKNQSDGWKLHRDIWNSNVPPED